jgi:hypothetical protein
LAYAGVAIIIAGVAVPAPAAQVFAAPTKHAPVGSQAIVLACTMLMGGVVGRDGGIERLQAQIVCTGAGDIRSGRQHGTLADIRRGLARCGHHPIRFVFAVLTLLGHERMDEMNQVDYLEGDTSHDDWSAWHCQSTNRNHGTRHASQFGGMACWVCVS